MSRRRERRARRRGLIGSTRVWVRRARRLALLASIGMGAYRWWQQKGPRRPGGGGGGAGRPSPVGGPKSPSALRAAATPEPDRELVGTATSPRPSLAPLVDDAVASPTGASTTWVEPLEDGGCPTSHPIKANDHSRIFHVPGGRFYDRTVAVRCYADPESATADGYRRAKA